MKILLATGSNKNEQSSKDRFQMERNSSYKIFNLDKTYFGSKEGANDDLNTLATRKNK